MHSNQIIWKEDGTETIDVYVHEKLDHAEFVNPLHASLFAYFEP